MHACGKVCGSNTRWVNFKWPEEISRENTDWELSFHTYIPRMTFTLLKSNASFWKQSYGHWSDSQKEACPPSSCRQEAPCQYRPRDLRVPSHSWQGSFVTWDNVAEVNLKIKRTLVPVFIKHLLSYLSYLHFYWSTNYRYSLKCRSIVHPF